MKSCSKKGEERKGRLVAICGQCKWIKLSLSCSVLFLSFSLASVYPAREKMPSGTGFYSIFVLNLDPPVVPHDLKF